MSYKQDEFNTQFYLFLFQRFLAEEGGLSESAIVGMVLGSVVFIAIIASATVCTLVLGKAWLKRYANKIF